MVGTRTPWSVGLCATRRDGSVVCPLGLRTSYAAEVCPAGWRPPTHGKQTAGGFDVFALNDLFAVKLVVPPKLTQ